MANVNLNTMDVDQLLGLRDEIDSALEERSRDLRAQLARLDRTTGRSVKGASSRSSALKGVKVAPKYQGPNGDTWAGRGARPKWLAELLEDGHSLEDFAITEASSDAGEKPAESAAPRAKRAPGRKGAKRKK